MNIPSRELLQQPGGLYDVLKDEFRMYGQGDFPKAADGLVEIYNDNYAHFEVCMMQDALDHADYGVLSDTDENESSEDSDEISDTQYPPIALGAALGLYCSRKAFGENHWQQIRNQTIIDWTIHPDEDTATELNAMMRFEFIDRSMKHISSNPFSRLNTAGLWLGYEIGGQNVTEFIRGFGHIALLTRTAPRNRSKRTSQLAAQ